MGKNGQNREAIIRAGHNYLSPKEKPDGALLMGWKGDATCKGARLATYKAGTKDTLTAVTAYTPGTSNKTAWFILNGVDLPGNTHIREFQGAPVDAVKFTSPMELSVMNIFVAPSLGANPVLCVIITAGSNQPTAEIGKLAYGTPGEGTFTGANNPVAVSLAADVHVTELKTTGDNPYVAFIPN